MLLGVKCWPSSECLLMTVLQMFEKRRFMGNGVVGRCESSETQA